ncbi:MEDS domain-containing protein [Candidatus Riflebacteria bacterium]
MNQKKQVSLGFTQKSFPAGTHMCLIYSHEDDRREIISKFIKNGIIGGERVYYIADTIKPEEVREWLLNMEVELPRDDCFSILPAVNTYCPQKEFIPQKMLHTIRAFYEQTVKDGYPGTRGTGEMSWALKGIAGSERLMEYEALLNEVLVTHPITVICQYDANQFGGREIFNTLKVHPMTIVHGQVVQNPFYMKPQEFLNNLPVNDS